MTLADDHDELWQSLQGLTTRMDPVPAHITLAAKESLAWRDTDAALASLLDDARLDADLAGVRGADGPELLTFTVGAITIEVEVVVDGAEADLIGQLVPPQPARIDVDHPDGPTSTWADNLGRFAVTGLARGHVRLTCHPDGGPRVRTEWTLI